jgi:HPt (histidine-containing phosphotransfer) domain-containing protein
MLRELPRQQQRLQSAMRTGELDTLAQLAHRVSGSASCCGTPALGSACRALRTGIEQHAKEDIPLLAESLQEQIQALLALHST